MNQSELCPKGLSEQSKSGSETGISNHVLDAIVDTMMPDIIAFFEAEEGQRGFEELKRMQADYYSIPISANQEKQFCPLAIVSQQSVMFFDNKAHETGTFI